MFRKPSEVGNDPRSNSEDGNMDDNDYDGDDANVTASVRNCSMVVIDNGDDMDVINSTKKQVTIPSFLVKDKLHRNAIVQAGFGGFSKHVCTGMSLIASSVTELANVSSSSAQRESRCYYSQ